MQYILQTNITVCQLKSAAVLAGGMPVLVCLLQAPAADALVAKQQAEASTNCRKSYVKKAALNGQLAALHRAPMSRSDKGCQPYPVAEHIYLVLL